MTFPAATLSACHVPPFISNNTLLNVIGPVLHASRYRSTHAPGVPPLSAAVSNTTLPVPPSCLIRQYFCALASYAPLHIVTFAPPDTRFCTYSTPASSYTR